MEAGPGGRSSCEMASQKTTHPCPTRSAFLLHTLFIQAAGWFISMTYILWVPGTEHTVPAPDHTTEQTRKLSAYQGPQARPMLPLLVLRDLVFISRL